MNQNRLRIANVRFTAAKATAIESGLIGWVSCILNNSLQLDGLALRRTRSGRPVLSFPSRLDSAGRQHFYLRPLDDRTRREIERQVFEALGMKEGAR